MSAVELGRGDTQVLLEPVSQAIEQHRDDGERERRLPDAVVRAMSDAGLFQLWTPKEYGGSEIDLPAFMEAVEHVSQMDGAAGWVFANLAAGAVLAAFLPEEGAKEIYANGPNVPIPGSVAPKGRATPVNEGYRLSGQWPLASGCHHGDWLGAVALVFDGDAPRMGPGAAPDFRVMFFRREDCQILDTWNSMGLRGTGSTDFTVADVFVPEHRVFSLFTTTPQVSGPLFKTGIMPLFSMALASVLLGTARASIDAFVALAREKTPTMSQTGLASRPTIHAEVARAEALVQSSRAYLYQVARDLMDAVRTSKGVPEDVEANRRLACVNTGASCVKAVDMVFALAGATPIYSGHRLERCLRDIHTAGQHLAVSPVWWEKTGQFYFGLGLGMP
ncbi:MAG: putative hydroxylase [Chloroflexi bacterium]|nr:putative hydroxylase [Chloroflexota bacterium]